MENHDQENREYLKRLRGEALLCMDKIEIKKCNQSERWKGSVYVAREAHDYMSEFMVSCGESPETALTNLTDKIIESFR